ncbi:type III-A CRISPR-associated RAMP protein Csm4 [Chondromyces apiculatus]|uniref:CRISPR system Cms protein Csm4 n=1 Tax=Chondromyces apiculatus DSM 436 TaxID=1192034 RepID=A0A017T4P6_9BACT|nr:hypothetical protein [Chondromyces apiculatus]EYF04199.1 CRISPR-associated RAMP protein, Csm4 family [Chondromyces apiculatus DSM 436]
MSVYRAFYLRFLAPVRVSAGASGEAAAAPDLPSDSLSAALVVAAAELGGERVPPGEMDGVAREPPWVVSSLLPWVGLGGRPVRFVPKPVDQRFGEPGGGKGGGGKRDDRGWSDVAYVSTDLLDAPLPTPPRSRCGMLAATPREAGDELGQVRWRRVIERGRAMVDRASGVAVPFHLGELGLGAGAQAGAWVAIRTETEDRMQFTRLLLHYLADCGIGADRARGLGRFEVVHEGALSVDETEASGRQRVLLGYASPDRWLESALEDPDARYSVVRREGRAHGALGGLGVQRKGVRLVAPGAVIPDRGALVGQTRDVTPEGFTEHRIYRDGRTLAWPLGRRT